MVWLTGWNRRKSIIINGSSAGTQTNYQMLLTVYYGSGTDTPGNIYLGPNVRNDFGDVRFTSSDGSTLLNYWIESYTLGVSAIVWIQIDSIPVGTATIYIYYGNATASSISNGNTTFLLYDDFLGTTIDNTKWTGDISMASLSGGIMTFTPLPTPSESTIKSIITFSTGKAIRIRNNVASGSWSAWGFQIEPYVSPYQLILFYKDANINTTVTRDAAEISINTNWTIGSYTTKEIAWDDLNNIIKWYENNVEKTNSPYTIGTNIPGISLIATPARGGSQTQYIDWVLVRKYISIEPTFGTTGTEESVVCNVPSCNLIILEILSGQLSRTYPECIDLEIVSKFLDDFKHMI